MAHDSWTGMLLLYAHGLRG